MERLDLTDIEVGEADDGAWRDLRVVDLCTKDGACGGPFAMVCDRGQVKHRIHFKAV